MKTNLKFAELNSSVVEYCGPFHEIAVHIRDLLKCEYALVATAENDSLRVQAIAGGTARSENLVVDLISKIREWGPVVVDDSRVVAVPVSRGDRPIGLLVGYSSRAGRFTRDDLERLMGFSQVAADVLENAIAAGSGSTRTTFSTHELMHFSRLITIGELSACFAHEVTNPLMLIRGHLRFAEEALNVDHPVRINLEVIDRASRRIEDIARRMLDFSRKRTPNNQDCDVAELISDAIRFMNPYFQNQYVDVQVQIEPHLPHAQVDRWQIVQAFVNLLQNAADAMAEREHRILTIAARTEANQMQIVISDTGAGIAPADLPRIFNAFFTTKGERGTGLGLYITKQVIEEHHGTITVQTGGLGTSFVISLPL